MYAHKNNYMMRYFLTMLLIALFSMTMFGQGAPDIYKGKVSFISSQNVYVKFNSTKEIEVGDTLFKKINGIIKPVLVVNNKSSSSSVCTPLVDGGINVSDEIIFYPKTPIETKEETTEETPIVNEGPNPENEVTGSEPLQEKEEEKEEFKQKIKGRITASSYSNLTESGERHRMRYAFSLRGDNLKNSRFSTDNYITFRHTIGEWNRVQSNLGDALKIYSLSVKYDFDKTSSLTLGRKINPKFSSIGAIDGLQYEKGVGQFRLGVIAGSRPDYLDYGINFNLMQAGAYVGFVSDKTKKYRQSTLGIVEQRNGGNVDRRFIYFQHSGEIITNLNLFTSFEADLYENINNEIKNKASLTNLYVSLRYRLSRKFRVSASYDTRKNIIYYESYKNFIDRLIENETRQGLRFGFNFRPVKFITWGVNSSLRFQSNKSNVSRNANSYVTISRIPIVNVRASLRVNFLETGYLSSKIYSIRVSKDIIKNKVSGDAYFRIVKYDYKNSDFTVQQKIAGVNCSIRLSKKLSFYVYYEGTYIKQGATYTRFNSKIIQRF